MREARFTKPLSMAVQPELYRKIKKITDEERISIAEWFRRVAEEALSNPLSESPEFVTPGNHQQSRRLNIHD